MAQTSNNVNMFFENQSFDYVLLIIRNADSDMTVIFIGKASLLTIISKNLLVYYCKCCNLIGYATRYLFVNRYPVATSNATRPSFSQKYNARAISFFEIILKK